MKDIKSKNINKAHKINKKYNCNSKMAVYLIECEIYVRHILAVQNQSLSLGQIARRVLRHSL